MILAINRGSLKSAQCWDVVIEVPQKSDPGNDAHLYPISMMNKYEKIEYFSPKLATFKFTIQFEVQQFIAGWYE